MSHIPALIDRRRCLYYSLLSFVLFAGCRMPVRPGPTSGPAEGSWPMPRHDARLTGQATIAAAIRKPQVVGRLELGATRCSRTRLVDLDGDGVKEILAEGAGGLLAVTAEGARLWHVETHRTPVVVVTDVDGDGSAEVVLRGPEVRSSMDGHLLWRPDDASARHEWRIHVGSFLPEFPGQQIATVTMHGYDVAAHVYVFEDGIESGRVLWERTFQTSDFGDFGGAMLSDMDADGDLELCAAVQGGIAALDLLTGEEEWRLEWEVDGVKVRNYGQIAARDVDGDGRAEVVLVNTLVALQVAVVRVDDGGQPSLVWNRHWGDWYPSSPYLLRAAPLSISDVDNDGRLDIALSVFEHGRGWVLQVVDASTGDVVAEKPGLYLDAVVPRQELPSLLLCSHQQGAIPARFAALSGLTLSRGELQEHWSRADAHLEGQWADGGEVDTAPVAASTMDQRKPVLGDWNLDRGLEFVIGEDRDRDGRTDHLTAIDPNGAWKESIAWDVDPDDDLSVMQAMAVPGERSPRLLVAGARGYVWTLDSEGRGGGRFFSGGAFVPGASAADLDGDGRNEIVVGTSDGQLEALRWTDGDDAAFASLWQRPGWGTAGQLPSVESPLLADLDGDGKHEVLGGVYQGGRGAGLACLEGDGTQRWAWFWPAQVPGPQHRPVRKWTVGRFGGREDLDVFVSTRVGDQTGSDMAQESWALDGRTGDVMWHRVPADMVEFYWYSTLGPSDLPSVWDVDGDGADDVLMMSQALMVVLGGGDGRSLRRPVYPMTLFGDGTPWTADGSVVIRDLDGDGVPEYLLTATFGAWGAMASHGEPRWSIDPGVESECTYHGGVADVDGDGRVELGMPHESGFRCYDAGTGVLEWELDDLSGTTDVITADIDGDGHNEFLLGSGNRLVALKGGGGEGTVLWSLDLGAHVGSPIVADIDGDGLGEIIAGTADGRLNIVSEEHLDR